jgi:hypothetical protein
MQIFDIDGSLLYNITYQQMRYGRVTVNGLKGIRRANSRLSPFHNMQIYFSKERNLQLTRERHLTLQCFMLQNLHGN